MPAAMPRSLPPLNQLRAFEAAARLESFKAAAAELCVTQTAVSHQIRALETRLGRPLFHRRPGGVRLVAGAAPLAAALTEALDRVAAAADAFAGTALTGRLHVSVAPFFANRWLLPRLPGFHADHPGLEVVPHLSFDAADLAAEGLDAAVRYGTGPWAGLADIPVCRDRLGPVAAPVLLADRTAPLSAEEVAALPRVAARAWTDDWPAWFDAAGAPDPGMAGLTLHDSRAFVFDAAYSGHAVCLADRRMTAADEAAGRLVRLHPAEAPRPQGLHIVHLGSAPDPRLRAFADALIAEAAALPD